MSMVLGGGQQFESSRNSSTLAEGRLKRGRLHGLVRMFGKVGHG